MLRAVARLEGVRPGLADDIYIAASSFEERCVAASRILLGEYRTRLAFLVNMESKASGQGLERKRRNMSELYDRLVGADERHFPVTCRARVLSPFDIWESLYQHAETRGICLRDARITIDISCLTRIQTLFLLRNLALELSSGTGSLRVLYSVPLEYITERSAKKHLGLDYAEPLVVPVELSDVKGEPATSARKGRRLVIAQIGHEGDRALNIWRQVDPERTVVVRTTTSNAQRNRLSINENKFFMRRIEQGDPAFSERVVKLVNLAAVDEAIEEEVRIGSDESTQWELTIVPLGPKPFLVGVARFLLKQRGRPVNLGYSATGIYDGEYSLGVQQIYSYIW